MGQKELCQSVFKDYFLLCRLAGENGHNRGAELDIYSGHIIGGFRGVICTGSHYLHFADTLQVNMSNIHEFME